MEFFFVLTISFLKEGRVYTHTYPDTIVAREGDDAESLYWRAYEMAQKKYDFHSVADVLHWSLMPNVLPQG